LTISQDIGWLLLRGVALSFLVSITLLPALLLTFEGKLTWKTLNLENIVQILPASVEKAVVPLFAVLLIVLIWVLGWKPHRNHLRQRCVHTKPAYEYEGAAGIPKGVPELRYMDGAT